MNNLKQQASAMFTSLSPGDLMILGARPGQGKTQLGLGLAVEAMKSGNHGAFFTLEYNAADVGNLFESIGEKPADFRKAFRLDTSDEINAEYIMAQLAETPKGTVVVVDYLQLLDQKRENPELAEQIRALKSFAAERGLIMVFLSQIDRAFDSSAGDFPSLNDVRLPNPLDLSLFDKSCFVNGGEMRFSAMN